MSQKKIISLVFTLLLALTATYFVDEQVAPTQIPTIQNQNQNETKDFLVTSVVDGDTIKVMINGKKKTIRVIGINTPETVDPRKPVECFGLEASNKAKELLTGKTITLESDPTQQDTDKYGRLLRYVFLPDGTDFGKSMIANGYAYEYTYNIPYSYQASYKEAQKSARLAEKGLWSETTCNKK